MRAVVQRVTRAEVRVDGRVVGSIGAGFCVLLGVAVRDSLEDARVMASKIGGLRVFPDGAGKMNRDLAEVGGGVLLVSQFTLLADVRKGRRPSFGGAADPADAIPLLDEVARALVAAGIPVATGEFGASMKVELTNDGPVTIVIEARDGSIL